MKDTSSVVSAEQDKKLSKPADYSRRAVELFSVPEVATKIKRLSDSGKASIQEIANIVLLDPGLAAQILKLANSAIYRFSKKIETIDKAIQIIGVRAVYEYALVFSVFNMLKDEHSKHIDVARFWRQSVRCSLLGKELATLCGEKDVQRIVSFGLLHNVGELAVLRVTPNLLSACNQLDKNTNAKNSQIQTLGFTFADISASLLQRWMLPDSIVSNVAGQHHEDRPSFNMETRIMQLAYQVTMVLTYPNIYQFDMHVPSFLYQCLDLRAEQIIELLATVEKESNETLGLFLSDSNRAA